ncbi:MAG: lysostaphin resistance A-like protein [Verrucomicrobiota bacterium]
MLSAKSWKTDALMRLFASVLVCVLFIGTIATSLLRFFSEPHAADSSLFLAGTTGAFVCFIAAMFMLCRTWHLENFIRNLAVLLTCIYTGFFLMWLATHSQGETEALRESSTAKIIIAVLSFQGMTLILVHFFLREHGSSWREAFGLGNRPGQALLFGIAFGFSAVPIGWGLQMFSGLLMDLFHFQTHEQEAIQVLRSSGNVANRIVLGITAIVLAPIAEEVLFRGILYPAIKYAGHPRLALWLTALLFGAIHANAATFLPLTVFAIALVWVYEKTDNLLAPIAAHSLFNTANFVMLFAADTVSRLPAK